MKWDEMRKKSWNKKSKLQGHIGNRVKKNVDKL